MAKRQRIDKEQIVQLLREKQTATIGDIRAQLGNVSAATAFRRLRAVPYRSSYNANGQFYSLHQEGKYDQHGLWSYRGIHFSRDGTLTATVERLVRSSPAGLTQRELQELLGVRVQNTLASLLERAVLQRRKQGRLFVYVAPEAAIQQSQLAGRRQREERLRVQTEGVALEVVIEIILLVIRHPQDDPSAVARRLRDRSHPIGIESIREVFERYGLEEKRGLQTSTS